jgi:hypothetical protein
MKCLAKAEQAVAFAFAGVLAVGADAATALADSQIAVYGGWNDSFDSDITLKQPNGTNMTLHDVPWDGVSFEAPPYWGIRGTWWLANNPNWGLMFDYSHAKVVADKRGGSQRFGQAGRHRNRAHRQSWKYVPGDGIHRRAERVFLRRAISLAA